MLTAFIVAAAILGIGTRLADSLRLRAEETILRKLDLPDAHAYYGVLAKRVRKTRILRALTVVSLLLVVMAGRKRLFDARNVAQTRPAPAASSGAHSMSTERARAAAMEEAARHVPAGAGPLRLETVSSDATHPWIFDFVAASGGREAGGSITRLRAYVDARGAVEVHRKLPDQGR